MGLREIQTANHLSSCGMLLGFTFQRGAISYVPARRAVSYLERTAGFSLLWHTNSASDSSARCLPGVYAAALFSGKYACTCLQKSLTSCKISLEELQGRRSLYSLPLFPSLSPFKRETVLLKMFPDLTQLMWRKCMWGVNVISAEQIRNVFHGHIPILVQS